MAMAQELGTIEKVNIHEVWPNEASVFTPWLAENLDLLGEVLGLELELQSVEAPVGGYSLDILATDVGSDRNVVIENQFGNTDHDHLGKLLTYAGGYDAYAVVWVAESFRDEHREALDLLNRRTGDETAFFGVVIEAMRIDDSRPAPHFDLVVTPNQWRRQTDRSTRNVSEAGERYRVFFQALADDLRNRNFTGVRNARAQNYIRFTSGYPNISYRTSFTWDRGPRVELHISARDKDWNKSLFDDLATSKIDIEGKMGESLDWERSEDTIASRIALYIGGSIDDDDETLEEIREWMVERLLNFREVFGPRLAELVD